MTGKTLTIATEQIRLRVLQRLRGSEATSGPDVVWHTDSQRVLLLLQTLRVRSTGGWLLCDLDCQTDQTGRCTLQFLFFLGRDDQGAGLRASATINAPTIGAARVADRFGADLQRVLWDAVLDAIEACVRKTGEDNPNEPLTLAGFRCDTTKLLVDVLVGAP